MSERLGMFGFYDDGLPESARCSSRFMLSPTLSVLRVEHFFLAMVGFTTLGIIFWSMDGACSND
jgi:hypothetical protein